MVCIKRNSRCNRKGYTLVSGADKGLRFYIIFRNAMRVIFAEFCKLRARFVVAGINEVRRFSSAFQRKFAEFKHAVFNHKFYKLLFISHNFCSFLLN